MVASVVVNLTTEERLLCRGLSKGWRATLSDPSLWRWLDVEGTLRRSSLVLAAASWLARGGVRMLNVNVTGGATYFKSAMGNGVPVNPYMPFGALFKEVARNSESLEVLRVQGYGMEVEDVEKLLRSAPHVKELACDLLHCTPEEAVRLLRMPQLHAPSMYINDGDPEDVPALAAAVAANKNIRSYAFHESYDLFTGSDALMHALVDGKQPSSLHFTWCDLRPAHALLLVQALPHLDSLSARDERGMPGTELLNDENIDVFCAAIRASRLSRVLLCGVLAPTGLSVENSMAKLLSAMTGHQSLSHITLGAGMAWPEWVGPGPGQALARLVDASGPLRELELEESFVLCDSALELLFEAVARSTTLTSISVTVVRWACDESVRNTILPAILENASLRRVTLRGLRPALDIEFEAVAEIVHARARA